MRIFWAKFQKTIAKPPPFFWQIPFPFLANPNNMHARFPFSPLFNYPHLAAKEAPIWDRFVKANPSFADEADYDVTCGSVDKLPPNTPQYLKDDWNYLRAWKIDVVAMKNGIHYIIEVRPHAGLNAIGEIICKASMYQLEHLELPEVEPMLITDFERPDIRNLCAARDIGYIVV